VRFLPYATDAGSPVVVDVPQTRDLCRRHGIHRLAVGLTGGAHVRAHRCTHAAALTGFSLLARLQPSPRRGKLIRHRYSVGSISRTLEDFPPARERVA
jgi:hypothetical protein